MVYYNYVVRHPRRDEIIEYAKTKGYSFLKKYKLKNTEAFSKEIFNLPIFPSLKKSEMKKIVKVLNEFL